MAIARKIGSLQRESIVLVNLGTARLRQGRCQQAADHLDTALALFREIGYRDGEAEALARIGDVCLLRDRPDEATCHHAGQAGEARAQHHTALRLASKIGGMYEQARAHDGLAHSYRAAGDTNWPSTTGSTRLGSSTASACPTPKRSGHGLARVATRVEVAERR